MTPKVAVLVFPGTNCELDTQVALSELGADARLCWHHSTAETDRFLAEADAIVLPGGFAHGDYLRPGAIARFSPVMNAVAAAAEAGKPVLGICNGFQVLTEAGLLPGALRRNQHLKFICASTTVEVASTSNVVCSQLAVGERFEMSINHFDGGYTCRNPQHLFANNQVVLTYVDNPNGSTASIAAVSNRRGNVVGMMPHPERPLEGAAGQRLLAGLLLSVAEIGDAVEAKAA